ncbi:MAG: hypothetical protein GXO88_07130 [Chlorobi bacterium]|nr:hypothetical protein [Chlorobiota bacterium]
MNSTIIPQPAFFSVVAKLSLALRLQAGASSTIIPQPAFFSVVGKLSLALRLQAGAVIVKLQALTSSIIIR